VINCSTANVQYHRRSKATAQVSIAGACREEYNVMHESSTWIIPEAPAPASDASLVRERPSGAPGLRLGILDNAKSNADHLLAMILDGVSATLPITSIVRMRKPSSAAGAEQHTLDALAESADCVITAMAD
jgi:hypothetical protein